MINTGDKLLCTDGNACYAAGKTYTVGDFVNSELFELMTGCNDEHWYATISNEGIHVRFDPIAGVCNNAKFHKVETRSCA